MEFDFYKMYLEEMGNIPELGPEEEAVLLEGTARGERAARERLVEGSLGRALALAREYENRELPMSDLVQEANTALMLAAVEYDGSREWAELLEYRVRESIELALAEQKQEKELEENMAARVNVLQTVSKVMAEELGREATVEELAAKMKMSEEDYDAVLDTNLKGTFNCIRFVARQMIKQRGGRIINMSSVSGVLGNAGQANYSASKAGVIGLTKSAARELASRGVTVNAIAPGFINTEMTEVLSDKVKEGAVAQIPMGKFGETEDIANAVVFLASEGARYITGQVINVDGGMAM